MIRRFDLAPLDGITKRVFRRVWHECFGGADRYFIPFLSPTDQHILTPQDRRELENPEGLPQVPQVMAKRAEAITVPLRTTSSRTAIRSERSIRELIRPSKGRCHYLSSRKSKHWIYR